MIRAGSWQWAPSPGSSPLRSLAGPPAAVAVGAGSIWVADASGQTVSRIEATSRSIVDRIPVGGEPASIVWGGGSVWVATTLGSAIKRIDPDTSSVTQTVPLAGAHATAIAFGKHGLWAADATDQA